jgi:hypothetical protein
MVSDQQQIPANNPPPVPHLGHINSLPFNFDADFIKELTIAYSTHQDFQVTHATL